MRRQHKHQQTKATMIPLKFCAARLMDRSSRPFHVTATARSKQLPFSIHGNCQQPSRSRYQGSQPEDFVGGAQIGTYPANTGSGRTQIGTNPTKAGGGGTQVSIFGVGQSHLWEEETKFGKRQHVVQHAFGQVRKETATNINLAREGLDTM